MPRIPILKIAVLGDQTKSGNFPESGNLMAPNEHRNSTLEIEGYRGMGGIQNYRVTDDRGIERQRLQTRQRREGT
jgi:hypothetical protein